MFGSNKFLVALVAIGYAVVVHAFTAQPSPSSWIAGTTTTTTQLLVKRDPIQMPSQTPMVPFKVKSSRATISSYFFGHDSIYVLSDNG